MSEQGYNVTAQGRGPVVATLATAPMEQEQRWRCQVCGQEMGYSQPINLALGLAMMGAFLDYHNQKCGQAAPASAPAAPPVPIQPNIRVEVLSGRLKGQVLLVVREDTEQPGFWWCIWSDTTGNSLVQRERLLSAGQLKPWEGEEASHA